jgi:hypothetical protein
MAYRWINRHLKGDDSPVTEPELPPIEARALRAFPDALPADELNTRIDEVFVPAATNPLPRTAAEFQTRRQNQLGELRRLVVRSVPMPEHRPGQTGWKPDGRKVETGTLPTEPGIRVPWKYFPAGSARRADQGGPGGPKPLRSGEGGWLVVLDENESLDELPHWVTELAGDESVLIFAPRGSGPLRWSDPPPFYIRRALPLLGRTVDSCRLADTLAVAGQVVAGPGKPGRAGWKIAGRGPAGVLAAYAALLEPGLAEVVLVEPPRSLRAGPFLLNALRVADLPETLGLLAPRPLTICAAPSDAFDATAAIYRVAGGLLTQKPLP